MSKGTNEVYVLVMSGQKGVFRSLQHSSVWQWELRDAEGKQD